jgi:hypothetical protein
MLADDRVDGFARVLQSRIEFIPQLLVYGPLKSGVSLTSPQVRQEMMRAQSDGTDA